MFLLQMAGHPGSGKSDLSKKIAKRTGAIVIDRDIIKSSMINSNIKEAIAASVSYDIVFDLAEFYLNMELSVIIDTPCFYEGILKNGISIADKCGVDYKYIECRVEDYSIIKNRIQTRDRVVSQIENVTEEKFNSVLNTTIKPVDKEILVLDTSTESSYDMKLIYEYLM